MGRFSFLKLLFAVAILAGCAPSASAFVLDRQQADSVCAAMGTIWGEYIHKKGASLPDSVNAEYLRGVMDALSMAGVNDAYAEGFSQALTMNNRLEQVEKLGEFPVDRKRFAYYLERRAQGKNTGFTTATAEDYMNRITALSAKERNRLINDRNYLKSEAQREGVVKTPSGLLFEVLTEGEGGSPTDGDEVLVRYTGSFTDGTVFNDESANSSTVFQVNGTIPGFSEGLKMMKKGGRYRLVIPSELGYGSKGVYRVVPPDAVTVFDVQLLDYRPIPADAE